MAARNEVRFGMIGLGLMGREFASAIARWCHLVDELPAPKLVGICNTDPRKQEWYRRHFPSIEIATTDYRELLDSNRIDAVYCAVPHNLHAKLYVDIVNAGKHLLGEKPFGIDSTANAAIMRAIEANPQVTARCSSEFPFWPGPQRLIRWLRERTFGRLMEVRCGFHHSSDMDLSKPINWKRMVEVNGEYGCMGDLGMHIMHIPFRVGWTPRWVFADLQKIAEERPDGKGGMVPCRTWDNAVLTCRCTDTENGKPFTMLLETKRMAPGQTNTWFIEVYGTNASARFTTHDPKAFYYSETVGKEQPWSRIDLGTSPLSFPVVTGGIFEFGFSDGMQQMIAAFVNEIAGCPRADAFGCVTPDEAALSHRVMTAALESNRTGKRILLDQQG
jgi:predicted dehydrogenase